MSEKTEYSTVDNRIVNDSKNSWGQLFDSKAGRITAIGASSLHHGVVYSGKELRLHRKVYR